MRRAWDGHMLPGWCLKERVIFDYEIVYIMEGKAFVTVEDRAYHAVPGDLFIFRPRIRHSMKNDGNGILRQPHVHFDLYYGKNSEQTEISYKPLEGIKAEDYRLFREDINLVEGVELPEKLALKNRDGLEKILFDMIKEFEDIDAYSFLRLKADAIRLLTVILEEAFGGGQKNKSINSYSKEKMNVVGEYIRVNCHTRITLDQLAGYSNVSKSHMMRLFKKAYGVSPIQYQLMQRIHKARQMIATSANTISEIAGYLGFSDLQHFSKVFKRITGQSPSSFRTHSGERSRIPN